MRFNRGAHFGPARSVDPDTAIFYRELCGGCVLDKFWRLRCAWFPFFSAGARDEFRKTRGNKRRRVGVAVPFDWHTQELRHAMQNLHRSIFGVAAETNHCRDVEIEFRKRLR